MATIKWTKDDVIKKFQEAVMSQPTNGKPVDAKGIIASLIKSGRRKVPKE